MIDIAKLEQAVRKLSRFRKSAATKKPLTRRSPVVREQVIPTQTNRAIAGRVV